MVYALHKFKHYLSGNKFTFFVDHMTLIYSINKPQVYNMLLKWFLLFIEHDFKIVYKLNRFHLMEDAMCRLPNQFDMLKYLIKLVMFTSSHYNSSGYKMFMNTYQRESCQRGLLHHKHNIQLRGLNHLCLNKEYYPY